MASAVDGRCSVAKINWTKTAHNTRICTCICGHLGLVPIHTHTHTRLCGYGLSTGPTDGLSSWWLRNRSPPTANNNNNMQLCALDEGPFNLKMQCHRSVSQVDGRPPVLTATSQSNGNGQISTPQRIKTPLPITIKLCTIDYVHETNE